jgi:hypothetical protein
MFKEIWELLDSAKEERDIQKLKTLLNDQASQSTVLIAFDSGGNTLLHKAASVGRVFIAFKCIDSITMKATMTCVSF